MIVLNAKDQAGQRLLSPAWVAEDATPIRYQVTLEQEKTGNRNRSQQSGIVPTPATGVPTPLGLLSYAPGGTVRVDILISDMSGRELARQAYFNP
ncbi:MULTISPECIES: hypothetical protein [Gulbenkiania]|uniref:Curli assembly protein CsgC n=2 Tax=Gulbenkiania TaxID=397456 RepID=A0A0K6GUQ6_9NEIS|nr:MULTISPECIES: hypothetical protein [Gulbenkiania]TCW33954.1 hypothetical protein EV669_101491 [Gulbenkiania mobilis]CUA82323.1 hypothetical protein Ga0061063_1188 [Gulbenkiania indica]